MTRLLDKTVLSKIPPKMTNVVWADNTNPLKIVLKIFVDGKWVPCCCCCDGNNSGWKVKYFDPGDTIVYYGFRPRKQDKIVYLVDDVNSEHPNIFYSYIGGNTVYEWEPRPGETMIYDVQHQELIYYEHEGAEPYYYDRDPDYDIVEQESRQVQLENNTIHIASAPDIAFDVLEPLIDHTFRCQLNFDCQATHDDIDLNSDEIYYIGDDCSDGILSLDNYMSYSIFFYYDRTRLRGFVQRIGLPLPTYTILTIVDPSGSGTVSGAGTYTEGQSVTLVAYPAAGYQFSHWKINGLVESSNPNFPVNVYRDMNVVAYFEELSYFLLFRGGGSGDTILITDGLDNTNVDIYLEYSFDGSDWYDYTLGNTLIIGKGDLYFRAKEGYTNVFYDAESQIGAHFVMSSSNGIVMEDGYIGALVNKHNPEVLPAHALREVFISCSELTFIQKGVLLYVTSLGEYALAGTFKDCSSLDFLNIPDSIALENALATEYCLYETFKNCEKLSNTINRYPDTGVDGIFPEGFCFSTYEGCKKLTKINFPYGKTTSDYCFKNMFAGCELLIEIKETYIDTNNGIECMMGIFKDCISLTNVVLNCPNSTDACLKNAFKGCLSLKELTIDLRDSSSTDCIDGWLDNVAANGTITCHQSLNLVAGTDYPSTWTRVDL